MHLMKTDGSYKLSKVDTSSLWNDPARKYAILSHTWAKPNTDEVTFQDMSDLSAAQKKPGWAKIRESCKQAAKDGISHVWIDTCCIDKTDDPMSEINSMYQYYENAEVCYVLLSDLPGWCPPLTERAKLKETWKDNKTWEKLFMSRQWFERGWTLQELIAPKKVEFFNRRWVWIGSLRGGLLEAVSKRTEIPKAALEKKQGASLEDYTIAQRMSWAANRRTTKEEDMAYCLLGIFDIKMAYIAGEGIRAFERLQEQILARSRDHSILAWNWHPGFQRKLSGNEKLFAPHPKYFLTHAAILPCRATRALTVNGEFPYHMTNAGLHIRLPILTDSSKPAGSKKRLALLNCSSLDEKGQKERIALLVNEIDDGKSRGRDPIYEVYFEPYGKPNAKNERSHTRLIRVPQKSLPKSLKSEQNITLLNGFM